MNGHLRAVLDDLKSDPEALAELRELLAAETPQPPTVDGWMTTPTAATYLGMSLGALYKRTRRHEIPAVQESPGGKLYFKRSELDAWRNGAASTLDRSPFV